MPGQNGVVRFGSFEADLDASELRRNGIRLKLQSQPFRVLALLLQRPGQILTREELQQELWPSGTFVDFEQGLATAVNKARDALVVPFQTHATLGGGIYNLFHAELKSKSGRFGQALRNGQQVKMHMITVLTRSEWQVVSPGVVS